MSTKFKPVKSDKAPPAIGPYSCALDANGTIYLSGQLPIDENGSMPETVIEQAARCLINIKHLLEAAGLHMDNVVKTTVFITNMDDFDTVNLSSLCEFYTTLQVKAIFIE